MQSENIFKYSIKLFSKCTEAFQIIFSVLRCRLWGSTILSTWNCYLAANTAKESRFPEFSEIHTFLQRSYRFGSRKVSLLNDIIGRVWNIKILISIVTLPLKTDEYILERNWIVISNTPKEIQNHERRFFKRPLSQECLPGSQHRCLDQSSRHCRAEEPLLLGILCNGPLEESSSVPA